MKKSLKLWMAIACALVMLACLLPASTLAEEGAATPTDLAPAEEAAEEEPEIFREGYVFVKGGTVVYPGRVMADEIGKFPAQAAAYAVNEFPDNPNNIWLKITFDTEAGELQGYVRMETVIVMTDEQVAVLKAQLGTKKLPVVAFEPTKAEEPEEAVTEPGEEIPAEEPEAEVIEEYPTALGMDTETEAEPEVPDEKPAEEPVKAKPENKPKNDPKVIRETEEPKTIEEYGIDLDEIETVTLETVTEAGVRLDPDGLSTIFLKLEEGAEVTVLEKQDDWYVVLIDDKIGYVYVDDLAKLPDEEPEQPAQPEEKKETPKKVTIFSSRTALMTEGDPVYLTSKLEGFEDAEEILYVWKVDKGNGFEEIPGANEATYSFAATEETLTWSWHLTVLYY